MNFSKKNLILTTCLVLLLALFSVGLKSANAQTSSFWSMTENPSSGEDSPQSVVKDASGIYIGGQVNNSSTQGLVEKRSLANGSVLWTNNSVGMYVSDIALDATGLYVSGFVTNDSSGALRWVVKKLRLIDGIEIWSQNGPVGFFSAPRSIAVNSGGVYIGGDFDTGNGPGNGDTQWRIEKRDPSTGALVTSFGAGGVILQDLSANNDRVTNIAVDSGGLYIIGEDNSQGNAQWRIVKRSLTDGSIIWTQTENPSSSYVGDLPVGLALDSTGVYIGGYDSTQSSSDKQWRFEKRNLSDGSIIWSKTENPSIYDDFLNDIFVDSASMYIVGSDNSPGNNQWRIEKRDLFGTLMTTFGTGGIMSINSSSQNETARGVVGDSNIIYVVGSDKSPGNLQWRIDKIGTVPTVSITASPNPIPSNSFSSISWNSTNTDDCSITKAGSPWQIGTYGTNFSSGNLTSATTFEATCTGPGGTVNSSVTVNIIPSNPSPAPGNLTATPGLCSTNQVTLNWTTPTVGVSYTAGTMSLNPHIGLWVQDVTVTNTGSVTIPAVRVSVNSLSSGSSLYSYSGTNSLGKKFVQYDHSLISGGSVRLRLLYYNPSNPVAPVATYSTQSVFANNEPVIPSTATPEPLTANSFVTNGTFAPYTALGWNTTLGYEYGVQYSDDNSSNPATDPISSSKWHTMSGQNSSAVIPGVNGGPLGIDDSGPKESGSTPTASRKYRVYKFPLGSSAAQPTSPDYTVPTLTGYKIYRTGGATSPIFSVGSAALSYTDSTVVADGLYGYQISATYSGGEESAPTPSAGPVTVSAPPATCASAITCNLGPSGVEPGDTLSWSSTNATSCSLTQTPPGSQVGVPGISGSYTISSTLSQDTTYKITCTDNTTPPATCENSVTAPVLQPGQSITFKAKKAGSQDPEVVATKSGNTISVPKNIPVNLDWDIEGMNRCIVPTNNALVEWNQVVTSNKLDARGTQKSSGTVIYTTAGVVHPLLISCYPRSTGSSIQRIINISVTNPIVNVTDVTCAPAPQHAITCSDNPPATFDYSGFQIPPETANTPRMILENKCPTNGGPHLCTYVCDTAHGYTKRGGICSKTSIQEL